MKMKPTYTNTLKYTLISLAIIFVLLYSSLFIVHQTQQALILQFGELVRVIKTPGLHLKIPFIQDAVHFDNRLLNIVDREKELIAKDQKRVIISAYAKYKIVDPLKFFQTVRDQAVLRLADRVDRRSHQGH